MQFAAKKTSNLTITISVRGDAMGMVSTISLDRLIAGNPTPNRLADSTPATPSNYPLTFGTAQLQTWATTTMLIVNLMPTFNGATKVDAFVDVSQPDANGAAIPCPNVNPTAGQALDYLFTATHDGVLVPSPLFNIIFV
jgi:hypothetical protein